MPVQGPNDPDIKYIAEQFARGLEETKTIAQSIDVKVEVLKAQNEGAYSNTKSEISQLKNNIDSLNRLIKGDDAGQNSLLARIHRLEHKTEVLEEGFEEIEEKERDTKKNSIALKAEDKRGKWLLIAAAFSTISSIVVTVLNIIFK